MVEAPWSWVPLTVLQTERAMPARSMPLSVRKVWFSRAIAASWTCRGICASFTGTRWMPSRAIGVFLSR